MEEWRTGAAEGLRQCAEGRTDYNLQPCSFIITADGGCSRMGQLSDDGGALVQVGASGLQTFRHFPSVFVHSKLMCILLWDGASRLTPPAPSA